MRVIICDFDDSFTFNIYSELKKMYQDIQVVELKDLLGLFSDLLKSSEKTLVVLGPGPGHPSDYQFLYSNLKSLLTRPHVFIFGICLGHQILWETLGAKVSASVEPVHGHSMHYQIFGKLEELIGIKELEVQRYNSYAVKYEHGLMKKFCKTYYEKDGELIISLGESFLTYQFHPESVGTTFPSNFFKCLNKLLI